MAPPLQDKGKGKARARARDDDEYDDAQNDDSSHFQPERPHQGPRVGSSNSRHAQDQAKMRLIRSRATSSSNTTSAGNAKNGEDQGERSPGRHDGPEEEEEEQQQQQQKPLGHEASTPTLSQQSSNTLRSPTTPARDLNDRAGSTVSSTTSTRLQRLGSNNNGGGGGTSINGYYQSVLQRQPRVRIREDVTKHTSFDRETDGVELYNLWVGP